MIEAEAGEPLQAALIEEGAGVLSPDLDIPEFPFPETTETDFEGVETGGLSPSEIAEVNKRCEGYRYGTPGYPKDQELAFTWCTQSAELGDPYGQSILGALYYTGEGVEQSYRDALYWFTLAANRGMPYAAFALFQMYLEGNGTKVDQRTAFMYLSRSAELGGKEAMEVFAQIKAQTTSPLPRMRRCSGSWRVKGWRNSRRLIRLRRRALVLKGM
ncbi:sel1 repeat family protein [Kineobactrum salinum]|uniref:Sel1 repeat family protein n=2 Tax=Kineobactrum salinum TaxID=2708301 RepID=A0A6C0U2E3_9GAMM|nr:sel1 repeat family protein [Kineobactrum salinum]